MSDSEMSPASKTSDVHRLVRRHEARESYDADRRDEAIAERGCNYGVGCIEYGVCYAAAHGRPDECGRK